MGSHTDVSLGWGVGQKASSSGEVRRTMRVCGLVAQLCLALRRNGVALIVNKRVRNAEDLGTISETTE